MCDPVVDGHGEAVFLLKRSVDAGSGSGLQGGGVENVVGIAEYDVGHTSEAAEVLLVVICGRQWIEDHIAFLSHPKERVALNVVNRVKDGPSKKVGAVQGFHPRYRIRAFVWRKV